MNYLRIYEGRPGRNSKLESSSTSWLRAAGSSPDRGRGLEDALGHEAPEFVERQQRPVRVVG
eukprot:CAMPEP_0179901026 /NCGR_PEP_ID=MMETSP0982-20121206/39495_1 /TAXON_ID=483367 /ORGANISM="non described non described, Strain CCMP 2436" /LENGTH=61 /DNA_ID=CAMNT_0021799447 /DNA_START=30 /DNA_END=215 /DNA_ORIENTATION=-